MKKLLLSLAGIAIAFLSMSAQTIYMMGEGEGLSWEAWPGKTINPDADGSYTVTFSTLTKFKMSTAAATGWNDFNASAFGFSGIYGDEVFSTNGQTVNLVSWGEDQTLPATGSYTLKINKERTSMTVKANFAKPTTAPDVYLRGGMNGWGTGDKFTYDSTIDSYKWTGTIDAGVEFKIADANWGTINYTSTGTLDVTGGVNNLVYNDQTNMKLSAQFTGTLIFKITEPQKAATLVFNAGGTAPTYPENMYIIGDLPNGAWDPTVVIAMTNEGDGVYSIENVTIKAGSVGATMGYFAFCSNYGSWDSVNAKRWGPAVKDTEAIIGENEVDGMGDTSWSIVPGTYNMVFDLESKTVEISEGQGGIEPDPDPDPTPGEAPEKLYLIGNVNTYNWDAPIQGIEASNNNGTFTWKQVTVTDGYEGNGYFNIATKIGGGWDDTVNTENRYGATAADTPLTIGTQVDVVTYAAGKNASDCKSWMVPVGIYKVIFDFNNMKITLAEAETDGISDITSESGETVYYNMQGVRVMNPERGLFIKVVNGKAEKVVK